MIVCPLCKAETIVKMMDGEKTVSCPSCGAFKDVNESTGNTIWMRNGRLVLAEEDIKQQQKAAQKRGFDIKNLKGNELSHG
jgi:hypothetical protein